jgi:tRNA (guanine26-N2/guanine27-N2)-dimethyltransferase
MLNRSQTRQKPAQKKLRASHKNKNSVLASTLASTRALGKPVTSTRVKQQLAQALANTHNSSSISPIELIASQTPGVFYNPQMIHCRDVFVQLLSQIPVPLRSIGLCMEASGIRTARIVCELCTKHPYFSQTILYANDADLTAVTGMKRLLSTVVGKSLCSKNQVQTQCVISQQDATQFLLSQQGLDVIDIDPYGSPLYWIDSACQKISRDGILCVTATDLAPLCGTNPLACKRKYGATPLRNQLQHELAVRILCASIQKRAMLYDRACIPILCYTKDHYARLYFCVKKSKSECDKLYAQITHATYKDSGEFIVGDGPIGPFYAGLLRSTDYVDWKKALQIVAKNYDDSWHSHILAELDCVGLYDVSHMHKLYGIPAGVKTEPSFIELTKKLQPYVLTRTIFNQRGFKTTAPFQAVVRAFEQK